MALPFYLFILTLIFAPLAFGSVEYWSIGLIEVFVPTALLACCIVQFKTSERPVQVPGQLPLLLLLCWMAFQLVPLPPALVKTIAPAIFDAYQPLLSLSDHQFWIPLTVQPKSTMQELLRFSTYGLFFILTVQLLSRGEYLKKTITIVVWLGIAIGVEAIIQKLTSPHAIYWFRTSSQANFPVGPWVYSNHFAGFMAMVFPVVLALFLYYRPTYDDKDPLRSKILALFTMPGTNKHLLFGFGSFLIGVSILLSASRGGIVTLFLTLFLFIFFSSNLTGQYRNRWAVFLVILMLLMVSWLGSETIVRKFTNLWGVGGLNTSERLPVLLDSLKMIRDFFITGSGFGTFESTFPAYRTIPDATIIFDHAHNDYIELLSTGGLIGFLLAAWFILSVIIHSVQILHKRRNRYNQLVTIAALTAVSALLLHSTIDFQMYNGANGLYFFFFSGLAVAAANTRLHYRTRPTLLPATHRSWLPITIVLAFTVLACSVWYNTAAFRARHTFAAVRVIYLNTNIPEQRLQKLYLLADRAARLDPLEADYPFAMAKFSAFINQRKRAEAEYLRAAALTPFSGQIIQQLALTLKPNRADTTDSLLALASAYEPLSLDLYLTYADWLISSGKRPQAMTVIHQALQQQPKWTAQLNSFVFLNGLSRDNIRTMLPDLPQAWHEMGKIMELGGNITEAEYYYLQTLQYLDTHEPYPAYFFRLYSLYIRQHKKNNALEILRRAIEHLPTNSSFHKLLGDYYLNQKIFYRAIEEYQQALQLDPKDQGLKRQLDALQVREEKKL